MSHDWVAEKIVDVTVNYKGEDKPGKVGYFTRFQPIYIKDHWEDSNQPETIFGYVIGNRVTHMAYGHASGIDSWIDFAVTSIHARRFDEFYFDAGSNGAPLYIKYDELRKAMVELGLLTEDAVKYCEGCKHSKLMHSLEGEGMGECQKILDIGQHTDEYCPCATFGDSKD